MDDAADVIVALIDGQFAFLALLVSILKHLSVDFFIKNNIDIYTTSQSSKEAGDFILQLNKKATIRCEIFYVKL